MNIQFHKFQGTGNDFIILDNRSGKYDQMDSAQIKLLCNRNFGIGADGLMMLKNKMNYHFEMIYFNPDGSTNTMCGNGGRCIIKFASMMGIHQYSYHFFAVGNDYEAEFENENNIKLKMKSVEEVNRLHRDYILDSGSPHYVKLVNNLDKTDVYALGREIRYSKAFVEKGINVNFVESIGPDTIYVRTYERGVEDETLSCGTGVTAAALISAHNNVGFNRVEVKTKGGNLSVEFNKIDDNTFDNIWLCGPATFVFKGEIDL
jgi:diaminopimelate epimerase